MPSTSRYKPCLTTVCACFCIPALLGAQIGAKPQDRSTDEEVTLARAQEEQAAGDYARAAADYARATALDPSVPELWANRGVMEYLAGEVGMSIVSFKHALLLNPKLTTPMLFLGKAYVQTGKPELALPYLAHARALRPYDVEVLLSIGKADEALHREDQAAAAYAEAAGLAPDNGAAWFGLGVSSLARIEADGRELAATEPQTIWARALYADELLAQGRPVEAVATYQAATAAALPLQRATLARTVAQVQSQSQPDSSPLPRNSGEPLQQIGVILAAPQGAVALPPCSSGTPAPPAHLAQPKRNTPLLLHNAACAYWSGDYEHSAAAAMQVLEQSPHDAEALYWSIKANERQAVAAFSKFEELAPQAPATYDLIGDLYRHRRQPDNALVAYRKALALDAHDPAAQLGAASVSLSSGNAEQAITFAQAALADRPLDSRLNLLVAEALVAQHQFQPAEPYLEKCLSGPPEILLRVHALLGRVDAEAGKTQEAIQHYELALPDDEDGSLHYQLSRLYRKSGDVAQAQKAEASAKTLQQQRRNNAVIAVGETAGTQP